MFLMQGLLYCIFRFPKCKDRGDPSHVPWLGVSVCVLVYFDWFVTLTEVCCFVV